MGVGQREKATQKRVIKLFAQELGYTYLGDFTERKNSNIEKAALWGQGQRVCRPT